MFTTDAEGMIKEGREIAAIHPNMAGSNGMGFLCNLTGTPAVCYGVFNDDSHCHAPNEYIFLEDFFNGIKLSAAVLHDFAEV